MLTYILLSSSFVNAGGKGGQRGGHGGHGSRSLFELVGEGACRAPTASQIYGDYTCYPVDSYLGCNNGDLVLDENEMPTCPDGYLMCQETEVSQKECASACKADPDCVGIEVSTNSQTGNGKCELHYVELEYAVEQECYTINEDGSFELLPAGACRTLTPTLSGSFAGTFSIVEGGVASLEACQDACLQKNTLETYGQLFGTDVYQEDLDKADEVYQLFGSGAGSGSGAVGSGAGSGSGSEDTLGNLEWADFYPNEPVDDARFAKLLQLVFLLEGNDGEMGKALKSVGLDAPCVAVEYTKPQADESTKCELHHVTVDYTDPTACYSKSTKKRGGHGRGRGGRGRGGRNDSDCDDDDDDDDTDNELEAPAQ